MYPSLSLQAQDALRTCRFLQAPTQQVLIEAYLQGDLTGEELADDLIYDVLARAPALERELAAQAHERAEREREDREMEENLTRREPLFVRYDRSQPSTPQGPA